MLRDSRLGLHLLAGMPALLAGVGAVVLAVVASSADPQQLRASYFEGAVRHFKAGEYGAARLGFERVVALDGDGGDREIRYDLAVCLEAQGEHARAEAMIEALAPEDHAGYAPAHVWRARELWAGSGRSPAEVRAGEEHLLHALEDAPDSIEVNALLGQFYVAAGRVERALPFLGKVVGDRPELLMTLARAHRVLDDRTESRKWALEARSIFKRRAEADLNDHASRFRWVEAALFLEEFGEAVDALQREAMLKTNPDYPRALAQVFLAWSDAIGRGTQPDLATRLALLERGLALDPANMALLGRFSELIRAGGDQGDQARSALQTVVARGHATGPVHYALGLDAWEHGRAAEARLHWEEACRLSPLMPAFANNLAWILAVGPDPVLPRALEMINPVIDRWPNERRFRETRGQILAKMERWKEALPDLEAALTVYPDSADLHRTLAETYEHLDAPSMAAEHRKRADVLQPMPKSESTVGSDLRQLSTK
jgi:tetratricopeptide (TPR) repeat protein